MVRETSAASRLAENRFDHGHTEKNLKYKLLSSNQASRVWDALRTAGIVRPLLFLFIFDSNESQIFLSLF